MLPWLNALPLHPRSCLTLFDLVSPNAIFSDFLGNYFNKERCQKTLEIVASELSYYKEDDAFQRNSIHEPARAFFESEPMSLIRLNINKVSERFGICWDVVRPCGNCCLAIFGQKISLSIEYLALGTPSFFT